MKCALDDPTVAQLVNKGVKTTFTQEHQLAVYFVPGVLDEAGYCRNETKKLQLPCSRADVGHKPHQAADGSGCNLAGPQAMERGDWQCEGTSTSAAGQASRDKKQRCRC